MRGAHVVDADTRFRTTVGRPAVVIAVHDSGVKWDDRGAMQTLTLPAGATRLRAVTL